MHWAFGLIWCCYWSILEIAFLFGLACAAREVRQLNDSELSDPLA